MGLIARTAEDRLVELAEWLRIVIVNGPRQSGKTTLLRRYQQTHGGLFLSLDHPPTLEAARDDPVSFVRQGPRPLLIDEVQRGGDPLVRAIKMVVDEQDEPGQFILSGSSRFLTIPGLSESLAGRAVFVDLWPLAMTERAGGRADFCDRLFEEDPSLLVPPSPWSREDYLDAVTGGGYPEVLRIGSELARQAWFDSYLTTIINRDIGEFAQVHQGRLLVDLLRLTAARAGSSLVATDLANSTQLARETVRNYLGYLEMVFLLNQVPAWSTSLTSRTTKAPKGYVSDSGLAASLLEADADALRTVGHPALGPLLETFVLAELTKLRSFGDTRFSIRQYRDRDRREIDLVLETPDGRVAGIEIKASASPSAKDARHLRWLREKAGDRFTTGVVLHLGEQSLSFGEGIWALPVSALWGHAELPSPED